MTLKQIKEYCTRIGFDVDPEIEALLQGLIYPNPIDSTDCNIENFEAIDNRTFFWSAFHTWELEFSRLSDMRDTDKSIALAFPKFDSCLENLENVLERWACFLNYLDNNGAWETVDLIEIIDGAVDTDLVFCEVALKIEEAKNDCEKQD